jgi:sec-independent protein translocase protein TatA
MPELLIVLAIVVLLFGAKKIPDLAKGVGKGIKDFKKAVKEDDDVEETTASAKEVEEKGSATTETQVSEKKSENA